MLEKHGQHGHLGLRLSELEERDEEGPDLHQDFEGSLKGEKRWELAKREEPRSLYLSFFLPFFFFFSLLSFFICQRGMLTSLSSLTILLSLLLYQG